MEGYMDEIKRHIMNKIELKNILDLKHCLEFLL